MSELKAVESIESPRTRESLADDLRKLGLRAGMTVITHTSMSQFGWVCGGPVAVVQALMDVLTEEGTLVMPTQSADLSDPSLWGNPPVPESWWETIRAAMPAYDPVVTPTRSMGRVVEAFRTFPGVLRSRHPQVSFAAWGKHREQIIAGHSLDFAFGEQSPLARMYELDAHVLLLGVGYGNATCLHLSELRAPGAELQTQYAPVMEDGARVWKAMTDIHRDSDLFPEIGTAFEKNEPVRTGRVGSAEARLFSLVKCVDFGTEWLTAYRAQQSK
ncbi:aminoglycoside N(3)-acetyltransferase [Tumebacillus flagellatus]|uniref:Aminoglycoside N(3)-acetyltransferase n=1 Tax=Tumebacillus flagellatus TaxID=1157490 RepID=A0A074M8H6_9BACL|nr:AAC(3) family N-acetyltransferase [Tumebacillus flagellatus]KEO82287.1 aminoglycoside 3-N-acetyltransferase [Tumebacillus flagellatus]